MSFNNNDGLNTTSTGGRGEGFSDSRGGVESYGQGTGAGAYDPANTGLGGYDGQNQQRATADQTMQSGDSFGSNRADKFDNSNFDSSNRDTSTRGDNFDSSNNSGPNTGAFGRNRDLENPSFGGDDSSFGNTSTGQTFGRTSSGLGSGTGTGMGARDDFNDNNTANAPSRGGLDNIGDDHRDNNNNNNNNASSGARNDQFGGESQREREGGKPTFGDKARGTVEKLAGTVTKNQDLKERGQERKTGEF